MPILPNNCNPLLKEKFYKVIKSEPTASEAEIGKSLKKLGLDSLPDDKKKKEVESIKQILKVIKNPSSRVRLNALILNPVDKKTVAERLKHLPNLKSQKVELPTPDLSQVFVEGQCEEIAEKDFNPINQASQLEVDFNKINDILNKQNIEKHIFFDT